MRLFIRFCLAAFILHNSEKPRLVSGLFCFYNKECLYLFIVGTSNLKINRKNGQGFG